MNEKHYMALRDEIKNLLAEDATSRLLGTITIAHLVEKKTVIYPAIAKLLGVECECDSDMCDECWEVEEWRRSLESNSDEVTA